MINLRKYLQRGYVIPISFVLAFVLLYVTWMNRELSRNTTSTSNNIITVEEPKNRNDVCRCPKIKKNAHELNRLKPIFPQTDPYGETNISQTIDRRHPNICSSLLNPETKRCSFIPYFSQLNWDGVWQTTEPFITEDQRIVKWNLYSASCDRKDGVKCDLVRILSLSTKRKPPKPFCYLWKDEASHPIVVEAKSLVYFGMRKELTDTNSQINYMIECEPPEPLQISAVSISYDACKVVTNFVQITESETRKAELVKQAIQSNTTSQSPAVGEYDVAACLIALYYYSEDVSVKLVEWLELLKAMKVSKVFTYIYDIHPNNMKVLAHYEKMGFISITYFNNPSPYLNTPIVRRFWSQNSPSAYIQVARIHRSDCIIRNRHQYNYIYHLDRDEIPSMKRHEYLPDLIKEISSKHNFKPVSLSLPWQFFYDDLEPGNSAKSIPPYFYMLRHTLYTKECKEHCATDRNVKTIHDTRNVILIAAHRPVKCYGGRCHTHRVDRKIATTAHIRRSFKGDKKMLLEDSTLLKYKEIIGEVNKTLEEIKILK